VYVADVVVTCAVFAWQFENVVAVERKLIMDKFILMTKFHNKSGHYMIILERSQYGQMGT